MAGLKVLAKTSQKISIGADTFRLKGGKLETDEDVFFSSEDAAVHEDGEKTTKYELTTKDLDIDSTVNTGTVTDICNDEDLPEVEILSLIEEQIPKYRLRADTITNFQGYENQDWIQTPVLPHIDEADLTPELVEETLKYFILCADRLTQMTKTYNDIEAVTRLLEEKERDLELAARIGQTLLEKNKSLENRNEHLEELVTTANEKLNQLRHELSMKEDLIKFYTQNYDGNESTPDESSPEAASVPHLERKIKSLEEENIQLFLETSKLKSATEGLEEKEQKLVNDCVQQLDEAHQQLELFARELSEKSEECVSQKQEITDLLHQIVQLQKKIRAVTAENLDLQKTLEATQDSQNYLTREIAEIKEKNEELLLLLEEAQEELRHLRSKERPNAVRHNYMSSFLSVPGESLASELENSLRSDIDYPKGYSPMERKKHTWKIFETVRAAKNVGHNTTDCSLGVPDSLSASMLGTSGLESEDSRSVSQRSSMYFSDGESGVSEGYGGDVESLHGLGTKMGRPGVPGSTDLHRSLRRLSMRRANELNEMDFAREEKERMEKQRSRTESELTDRSDVESALTGRCRSPDSVLSANSGYMSMTGSGGNPYFRMPEKLRIVKPLEGSVTLRHWQHLAKPHLGGIFESRPGVTIKGEKNLDIEAEVYTLSDYEEDDDVIDFLTRFQNCSGVYTYTDSRVKHPSEAGRAPIMFSSSSPRVAVSDRAETSGTSTYSMSLGLASLLNERDLLVSPPERPTSRPHRATSSNPERFPSLVSDSLYNPAPVTPTSSLVLPTNNYNLITSSSMWTSRPVHEHSNQHMLSTQAMMNFSSNAQIQNNRCPELTSETGASNYSGLLSTGTVPSISVSASPRSSTARGLMGNPNELWSPNSLSNALGVINKLKDKGMDLYGYLSGEKDSQNSESGSYTAVGRPSSLPIATISTNVSQVSSGSTTNNLPADSSNRVLNASQHLSSVSVAPVASTGVESTGSASKLYSSLFSKKTAGGVLGALAKFHRDGSL